MTPILTFLGATRNVTGSRYLLEANGTRVLVDSGLHQERDFRGRDWSPFPVQPGSIDAVLLTHAHLDHCGYLPKLVRDGFDGPIYCTSATAEIVQIELMDAAHLMREDAEFKKRRHEREGRKGPFPEVPLYTVEDAVAVNTHFKPVKYEEPLSVAESVEATFHDAGHVLGSAMIEVKAASKGTRRTIIFSGDIGRESKPFLHDPTFFKQADYVVMESTYGNREVGHSQDMSAALAGVINYTVAAGGNVVIPAFAMERAQEVLYYINHLLRTVAIPHLNVFLDSPMAISITDVFKRHPELLDEEMLQLIREGESPFDFSGLRMVTSAEESMTINGLRGTNIIIAGSGMCTGGRIKHHLAANISRPESTILFVGYQAVATLGRIIVDGAKQVRIHGQQYPVKAKIIELAGFSAHADRDQLLEWVSSLQKPPRCVFITHGEEQSSLDFAKLVHAQNGWQTIVPQYEESFPLD